MKTWLSATRPATLLAGVAPIAVGTALAAAESRAHGPIAALCLAVALALQIGCNLVNDVADADRGADGPDRLGPQRATSTGALSRRQVITGAAVAFGAAAIGGGVLVWWGGALFLWLGLAAIITAIAYTAGPFPLGYNGLGEVAVLAFFGFVAVGGTFALQAGYWSSVALAAGGAIGALASAVLTVNNLRDREGDANVGKRTLAARFGAPFARAEYIFFVGAAFGVCIALAWFEHWGWLLPLVCLPIAAREAVGVLTQDGKALNARLAGTARLELVFAVTLSLGVLL